MEDNNISIDRVNVILPLCVVEYFSQERKFTNRNKYTRTRAFYDLIKRCLSSKQKNEDMAVNISELSKSWHWSMPSVKKFLDRLDCENMVSVEKIINNKIVVLNSDILV